MVQFIFVKLINVVLTETLNGYKKNSPNRFLNFRNIIKNIYLYD